MYTDRATISVSDSLGNLLFYGYPGKIFNRNHQVMPNGDNPNFTMIADQSIAVIPKINDDSSYYIFIKKRTNPINSSDGLYYSVLNMRLDGGLGDIEPGKKNLPLDVNGFAGHLTTARHKNNRDAWIVFQNPLTHTTSAYLVTATGISPSPVISPSSATDTANNNGYARISPDGKHFIYPNTLLGLDVYCKFNSETGEITQLFRFFRGVTGQGFGYFEFSRESKYVYVSNGDWGYIPSNIYQFDATKEDSAAFKQSQVQVGYYGKGVHLQRGPDGKIYGAISNIDSLCIINDPEAQGSTCNFQPNGMGLNYHPCLQGLPDLIQRYYLYIRDTGDCAGLPVHFYPWTWPPPDSIHWDFGDPASGAQNTSTIPNATHIYSNPGNYLVHLFVRHNDKRTDTISKTITIIAGPLVALGSDRTICTGDSTTFDAGACPGCTYQWKELGSGSTVGTSQTYRTGATGTYVALVTNLSGCTGMDTVQLMTTTAPSVTNNPLADTICTGDSTGIHLTSSLPGTTFYWTASLTSGNIAGFSADSGMVIDQVLTNSLSTPGIVTYHITPKIGNCAGVTVDYQVTVNPGDSVKVSISSSANNICEGTSVTYTATPTNPGTTPSYQWKVNGTDAGTNSTSFSYTPANGDVVTCVLTASVSGCSPNNPALSNQVVMVVNSILTAGVTVSASSNPVCAGASVTFTATPVNGGILPTFEWLVDGVVVQQGGSGIFTTSSLSSGQTIACRLTSSWPCLVANPVTSVPLSITVAPDPVVTLTDKPYLCVGDVSKLDAGPDYASYRWQDGSTGRYLDISGEGVYYVTVTDNAGCKGSDTARIQVCEGVIYMPTAFTPDGDGLNDIFKPVTTLEGISNYSMLIYDRWGTEVFKSGEISTGWNGTIKGQFAPPGTYVWKITYQTTSQGTTSTDFKMQGTFVLVR
ncbi:MAG: gliding motility-associated C-terminal domain-containing protein [Bacteroidetes bacterium]|nr:gliding motility-associated C-terminal domain-containing protein [Bacteroidota bacterium]